MRVGEKLRRLFRSRTENLANDFLVLYMAFFMEYKLRFPNAPQEDAINFGLMAAQEKFRREHPMPEDLLREIVRRAFQGFADELQSVSSGLSVRPIEIEAVTVTEDSLKIPVRNVTALTIDPKGRYFVTRNSEIIRIWSLADGAEVGTFTSPATSNDASGLTDGADEGTFTSPATSNDAVGITPDGKLLVTGYQPLGIPVYPYDRGNFVGLWRLRDRVLHKIVLGNGFTISADGRMLATTTETIVDMGARCHGSVQLWKLPSGVKVEAKFGATRVYDDAFGERLGIAAACGDQVAKQLHRNLLKGGSQVSIRDCHQLGRASARRG